MFSLETKFAFLFRPYIHDSVQALGCQPLLSHVSDCSQSVWMAHQVVMVFPLLQHSFLHALRGVLFSVGSHWLLCKLNPTVDQNFRGALKARYVLSMTQEPCPSGRDGLLPFGKTTFAWL